MNNEICVPADALRIADEGDKVLTPEPGDPVSFQVDGEVTRVEGNMVYVRADSANGEPIPQPEMAAPEGVEDIGEELGEINM